MTVRVLQATTWDDVKLVFKLNDEKSPAAAPPPVVVPASSSASALAPSPAAASAAAKSGTVTGEGRSCWHSYVIPFTINGTFDLTSRTAQVVKQHMHEKYNNAINYKIKLSVDGPASSFELTSDDPNLSLRPIVQLQPEVREEDLCKGWSRFTVASGFLFSLSFVFERLLAHSFIALVLAVLSLYGTCVQLYLASLRALGHLHPM
jgi:hypothetical protein